jgi:hypothetical protein
MTLRLLHAETSHVLYLDFDGCLHPEGVYWGRKRGTYLHDDYVRDGHRLFENAQLLEELLAPYPHAGIVLSTSWVKLHGFKGAAKWLPQALQARCIGATYHSAMEPHVFTTLTRGEQVRADAARRLPAAWLAIDDHDEGWTGAREHVVITDPVHGIAEPHVLEQLRLALERFR